MCDCSTNPCGCDSGITLPYLTGASGQDGLFGGFSAEWKFDSSSTASNPAVNYMRSNNSTLSSVSELYFNQINIDGIDHNSFLSTFTNSNNYGLIKVWKQYQSNTFIMGTVTGVVDTGDHYTIALTGIVANGSFTADDNMVVSFTPMGADGASGSNGSNGVDGTGAYVIDGVFTGTVDAGEASTLLGSISIPADTLSTNEDMLEFSATLRRTQTQDPAIKDNLVMSFGVNGYLTSNTELVLDGSYPLESLRINGRLYRESATALTFTSELYFAPTNILSTAKAIGVGLTTINQHELTSNVDFTAINLFQITMIGTTAETITLNDFVVRYIKRTS